MINRDEYNEAQARAFKMVRDSGITIKDDEINNIEVVDFGLGQLEKEGIQVLTFFSTDRISAKVLVLFPGQTEPEHWHPQVGDDVGKEEIIRAISGELRFYIPGDGEIKTGFIPKGKELVYTMKNEIIMKPGDQLILSPGTRHWFQAGNVGAVMYSFSTCVRDDFDKFTDPDIIRETKIMEP